MGKRKNNNIESLEDGKDTEFDTDILADNSEYYGDID